jgi:phosphatidylserine/phosphatidylglycerophosphate/cardiolipin synthase-like enzyme
MGSPRALIAAMPPTGVRAYSSGDDAFVVWAYDAPVADCRGFALYRRPSGSAPEPVRTFVPFAGDSHQPGQSEPSTTWPIQKFTWTDLLAHAGETVAYRAVPLTGDALVPDDSQATPWTDDVTIGAEAEPGLQAYFNRGVLATQAVSRRLAGTEPWTKRLRAVIATPGDPTREYLSGSLRVALLGVLAGVAASPTATAYAALFELDDPELIAALVGLGSRAHVVLANGTGAPDDENKPARDALRAAGVDVHDRMVTRGHLSHDKFLVVCDPDPARVWTGSTNWTMSGLCTQVNNAVLIDDPAVAATYRAQWDALVDAGSAFPPSLLQGDAVKRTAALATGAVSTWFAPLRGGLDLADARALIDQATQGILFLMFNPGRTGTLLNDIMARADPTSTTYDPDLYVHGVLNQDPEAGSKDPALVGLIHRGQLDEADPDIVLPGKIDERFSSWEKEIDRLSLVMVHSKIVVLDPFGEHPVVMTGSHNLGPQASAHNDDNLNLITGAPRLAAAYATHIMAVYTNYRWRYVRSARARAAGQAWSGPVNSAAWQDAYFTGPDAAGRRRELAFWLGES